MNNESQGFFQHALVPEEPITTMRPVETHAEVKSARREISWKVLQAFKVPGCGIAVKADAISLERGTNLQEGQEAKRLDIRRKDFTQT